MSPFTVPHFQLKENHKQCSMNDRAPQSCFALSQFVICNIGNTCHLGMDTVCTSRRQINPFLSIVLKIYHWMFFNLHNFLYWSIQMPNLAGWMQKYFIDHCVLAIILVKHFPRQYIVTSWFSFKSNVFIDMTLFSLCLNVGFFFSSKVANVCLCWEE